MEAALNDLASTTQGALEQDAINAVIEQFSGDLEQETPFSLNGTIYKAINRYISIPLRQLVCRLVTIDVVYI